MPVYAPPIQARIASSSCGWRRTGASSASPPIRSASGRDGSDRSCKEGDRQAPEGFYTVAPEQLNPNSRWHRSFSLGFPNVFDKAKGRTGSFLMVHGGCASIGCYAMTDPVVDEIWRLVTAALDTGQARVPVHVFPFRMTDGNLKLRRGSTMGRLLGRSEEGLRPVRADATCRRWSACAMAVTRLRPEVPPPSAAPSRSAARPRSPPDSLVIAGLSRSSTSRLPTSFRIGRQTPERDRS